MNNSSEKETLLSADCAAISVISTTKQDLLRIKKKHPKTFVELRTFLLQSQLEARRIEGLTRLAIKRLNSI